MSFKAKIDILLMLVNFLVQTLQSTENLILYHFPPIFNIVFLKKQKQILVFLPIKTWENTLKSRIERFPALRAFWDLEKTVLHKICVSGTVLWSPTNANSPTYMYLHTPKTVVVETVLVVFV